MKSLLNETKIPFKDAKTVFEKYTFAEKVKELNKLEIHKPKLLINKKEMLFDKMYYCQFKKNVEIKHVLNTLHYKNTENNYNLGVVTTHAEKIITKDKTKEMNTYLLPNNGILDKKFIVTSDKQLKEVRPSRAIVTFINKTAIQKWEEDNKLMHKVTWETGTQYANDNNEIQSRVLLAYYIDSIINLINEKKILILIQNENKNEIVEIDKIEDMNMLDEKYKLGEDNIQFLCDIFTDKKTIDEIIYTDKNQKIEELELNKDLILERKAEIIQGNEESLTTHIFNYLSNQ